jgi:lipopolysaccharide transport system ATP-binding protein
MSRDVVIEAVGVGKIFANFRRPADRVRQLLRGGRRREEFWALRGVDLEVLRGETLGIVGRNGAGKSTLLQLICGTLAASSGRVQVRGRVAAMLELGAGFNRELTGRENVYLNAMILGLSEAQIAERFASIADFAGIGAYMEQPVKHYSSGMQARLGFAVCVHVDADILVIDEVLGVGDGAFQQRCMRYLQQFRRHGTVLLVSHDSGTIARLCDRVLWLDAGQVRAVGPAEEICQGYLADLASKPEGASRPADLPEPANWQPPPCPPLIADARASQLRGSNLIRISDFDAAAPWHGFGGARVEHVAFHRPGGGRLTQTQGGEEVELRICCRAERQLAQPIVGFILRDRLGQNLFGDNTYLVSRHDPPAVASGQPFSALFRFQLPFFPVGSYALAPSIIEGSQHDHIHLHWMEEAIILQSISSHVRHAVVGLAMEEIAIDIN